jgi:pimeloyl-ACP methyl ester carboxylesterase
LVEGNGDRLVLLFGADGDPGPELTWARGITLAVGDGLPVDHPGPVGVVGTSGAGLDALAFAERHAGTVDRLVLISTPIPPDKTIELSGVSAKTLLLFAARDEATGARHGRWWQQRLDDARLEVNPQGGPDLLEPMWKRVLSHLAPHCKH